MPLRLLRGKALSYFPCFFSHINSAIESCTPSGTGTLKGQVQPWSAPGGPAPPLGALPGPSAAGLTCHLLGEGGEVARQRCSCRLAAPTHGGEDTPRVQCLHATLWAAGSTGKRLVKSLCGIRVQGIALQKYGPSQGCSGISLHKYWKQDCCRESWRKGCLRRGSFKAQAALGGSPSPQLDAHTQQRWPSSRTACILGPVLTAGTD